MEQYLNIVKRILSEGIYKENRTGTGAYTIAGAMFQHDMQEGFPLLTTKKMAHKNIFTELEFFIKGLTDKMWLQERKCFIWDEWCCKINVADYKTFWEGGGRNKSGIEDDIAVAMKKFEKEYVPRYEQAGIQVPKKTLKQKDFLFEKYFKRDDSGKIVFKGELEGDMLKGDAIYNFYTFAQMIEHDLGPIYGWQWRHWGEEYVDHNSNYDGKGLDQLKKLTDTLIKNPQDRRMLVSAWNPNDVQIMALPACHYGFQVTVIDDRINLLWNQRSVDTMLGLPFNIASYGLLLHLLTKETNTALGEEKYKEGTLTGFLADVHIYKNQVEGANEQVSRDPHKFNLPRVKTDNFSSIYSWESKDSVIENYESYGKIDFGSVAV